MAMMYEVDVAVTVTGVGIAVLGGVYVWSGDPGRRARAMRLIRLLLRH